MEGSYPGEVGCDGIDFVPDDDPAVVTARVQRHLRQRVLHQLLRLLLLMVVGVVVVVVEEGSR